MNIVLWVAEFLSLWASLTGLGLAALTVKHWWPSVNRFFSDPQTRTVTSWLSVGIFISFAAALFDSGYWHLAWTTEYVGFNYLRDILFRHGVLINLPFRNIALIVSAYCHIRAYLAAHPNKRKGEALELVYIWIFIGFVGVCVLSSIRFLYA